MISIASVSIWAPGLGGCEVKLSYSVLISKQMRNSVIQKESCSGHYMCLLLTF